MKLRTFLAGGAFLLWATMVPVNVTADSPPNTLTEEEKEAGWKLLFNGQNFDGWHNFKRDGVRPGWQVKDEALV
jgi:hypothetical protein